MITLALVGFIVGILSSISGLGGGFMVVPLLIYLGREAKLAVGTSFVFILVVAISSIISHYRLGNIDIKTGLTLGLGGIIGAQIGPQILQHVSEQNFKRIFAVLLAITAVWIFVDSKS
ncbi:MAG: sulfite exporter TauE/SafE family protein [Nitrospinales bacterium]|nr:sulfite exporter TauE/SafE family protein [Nitrospinales bacterium]|tara:strand:+ start:545 stop:898 length:354 start_codon:yes stop_codon:yes gene_type:complete